MANSIALILCIPVLFFLPKVSLLKDLGVDESAPLMAVLFGICCFFISKFMIKPYQANLAFRKKNTAGSLDQAALLEEETNKLALDFQSRLKKQNDTTQGMYEKLKAEGLLEEEKLIAAAKKSGAELVEGTKKKIAAELFAEKEKLKNQVPIISELIASRVLGRDIR